VGILVDSGNSNSFINAKLAPSLAGLSQLSRPVRVDVANGQVLQCVSEFQVAEWSIQGMSFVSDLRVLPLPHYDMIIGMHWLEVHSPMRIDWKNKWISITQAGSPVLLHELQSALPELSVIEIMFVQDQVDSADFAYFIQNDLPVLI
jgi:hypothetical protein